MKKNDTIYVLSRRLDILVSDINILRAYYVNKWSIEKILEEFNLPEAVIRNTIFTEYRSHNTEDSPE